MSTTAEPPVQPVRTVAATRYVTPLREGGSLPGLMEADDDGLYVVKFHGAGQGPKALVAELVAGELGRALGLPVPEIVLVDLDPATRAGRAGPGDPGPARTQPGAQPRARLPARSAAVRSRGRPAYRDEWPAPDLAADIVWFDGFVTNVDRTATQRQPARLASTGSGSSTTAPPSTSTTPGATRPGTPAGRSSGSPTTCSCRARARSSTPTDGWPPGDAELLDRIVAAIPDAWLRRRRRPAAPRPTSTTWGSARRPRARSSRRPSVPEPRRKPFEYAIVRVVPRVERGEQFNAGVVLHSRPPPLPRGDGRARPGRPARARPGLRSGRGPGPPRGDPPDRRRRPDGGPIAGARARRAVPLARRPGSTIVQPSPVHTGLTDDPAAPSITCSPRWSATGADGAQPAAGYSRTIRTPSPSSSIDSNTAPWAPARTAARIRSTVVRVKPGNPSSPRSPTRPAGGP